jgi:hypothetical protein
MQAVGVRLAEAVIISKPEGMLNSCQNLPKM